MPDIDAQVIIQGVSNLPRDRFINTLHFSEAAPVSWTIFAESLGPDLVAAWAAFSASDSSFHIYPSQVCNRAFEVRLYNPDDAVPRTPRIFTGTLATVTASTALPTEVALCLSYRTDKNAPSKRGRIYLGPFSIVSLAINNRPTTGTMDKLLNLADTLSDLGADTVDWQLYSPKLGTRRRIEFAWVDNEFDTQRRRGIRSTSRVQRAVTG
jgi:hypothetical protein